MGRHLITKFKNFLKQIKHDLFGEALGIFALKKIVDIFFSIIFFSILLFLILRFIPGGPFDGDLNLHPSIRLNLMGDNSKIGNPKIGNPKIDNSYVDNLIGDWQPGKNLSHSLLRPDQSVLSILMNGFRQSFLLDTLAVFVIYFLSVLSAVIVIVGQSKILEIFLDQISTVFISLPALFIGPVLIYVLSIKLQWFPLAFLESPMSYVLPILTLSLRPAAFLYRILKLDLNNNMRQEYCRFAKSKGLSRLQIILSHALPNSLGVVLNYSSSLVISMFSASFVVELLFSIPGIGSEFIRSLDARDYPVIAGIVLSLGVVLFILTSFFDFLRVMLDPRQLEREFEH